MSDELMFGLISTDSAQYKELPNWLKRRCIFCNELPIGLWEHRVLTKDKKHLKPNTYAWFSTEVQTLKYLICPDCWTKFVPKLIRDTSGNNCCALCGTSGHYYEAWFNGPPIPLGPNEKLNKYHVYEICNSCTGTFLAETKVCEQEHPNAVHYSGSADTV